MLNYLFANICPQNIQQVKLSIIYKRNNNQWFKENIWKMIYQHEETLSSLQYWLPNYYVVNIAWTVTHVIVFDSNSGIVRQSQF